jgi:hypothetical protein
MPLASDFARRDCVVGNKRRSYATLIREWRCNNCGGRLVKKFDSDRDWIECGRCGGQDVVHHNELRRQHHEAGETLDALPDEYRDLLGQGGPSLSLDEYNRIMHGSGEEI